MVFEFTNFLFRLKRKDIISCVLAVLQFLNGISVSIIYMRLITAWTSSAATISGRFKSRIVIFFQLHKYLFQLDPVSHSFDCNYEILKQSRAEESTHKTESSKLNFRCAKMIKLSVVLSEALARNHVASKHSSTCFLDIGLTMLHLLSYPAFRRDCTTRTLSNTIRKRCLNYIAQIHVQSLTWKRKTEWNYKLYNERKTSRNLLQHSNHCSHGFQTYNMHRQLSKTPTVYSPKNDYPLVAQ